MCPIYTYTSVKNRISAIFGQIRLANTELAATWSNRQIKALTLVFRGIKKINPAVAGNAILCPIYTHTSVKNRISAIFGQIRLADTELAATWSNRQIKALTLVFRGIKKINPAVAGNAILCPIYTHTSVKNRISAIFGQIRLADTELTATRSYRQIEALTLVY